ncbi:30S ribosomal protein S8 [Candidatus Hodgkinia cicadicola]|nr:30S ribosomal protein S8 [Candidatus Hodgkinia cicadicola]
MTGSIADMISHINNCVAVNRNFIYVSYSKYRFNVLNAIKQSGHISRLSVLRYSLHKADIAIEFKLVGKRLLIRKIVQISKPGNRIYWTRAQVARKFGVFILSTCKGVVNSAFEVAHGGEIVCKLL